MDSFSSSPQLLRKVRVLPKRPSIRPERALSALLGGGPVAGVDEAGRGPLAGPVVAAAVILNVEGRRPAGLQDSKKLSPRRRQVLARAIRRTALSFGIGVATPAEIDAMNILEATRLAVRRAVGQLLPTPAGLVTDALLIPHLMLPTAPLVKGDCRSASIAAASILAKTHRDALMDVYAEEFPEYNWRNNRGYPTPDHLAALELHGPSTLHRMSFRGVGFFTFEPRRSHTCQSLMQELQQAVTAGEEPSFYFPRLRTKMQQAAGRLPPSELEELNRLFGQDDKGDGI